MHRELMMLTTRQKDVVALAKRHGWELEQTQLKLGLFIFVKGEMQINVWTTTMTVGTALDHPILGRTQLFRRDVSKELLTEIFENPRTHTDRGYYRRPRRRKEAG